MRTLEEWLDEYGQSHKNETNKSIHWICVPAIFYSVIALLYSIKLGQVAGVNLNLGLIIMAAVIIYYASLSKTLWIGMLVFGIACLALSYLVEIAGFMPLWLFAVIVFIAAWIGQFYGHKIEGKKPSFLKDLQFLLIGPAWLMSFIFRKLGIPF